jgi:6-pyruvoyltetrahydropterin/6-carboxytetrahydropterin synthase
VQGDTLFVTLQEIAQPARTFSEGQHDYSTSKSADKGYELGVDLFFNASHRVRTNGQPGPTHPHSWRVQARFSGDATNKNGILVGFAEAKEIVQQRVSRFNGQLLNDIKPFDEVQPTSENLASILYNDIKSKLEPLPLKLHSVSIWESPTNFVTYSENGHTVSSTPTG